MRWRRWLAGGAVLLAVVATTAPAAAHACGGPMRVPVGRTSRVDVPVTAAGQPVVQVVVGVPRGFELAEVPARPTWEHERRAGDVRFFGGAMEPYSCESFSIVGVAVRRATLTFPVSLTLADGSVVPYVAEEDADHGGAQLVYAGTSPPPVDEGPAAAVDGGGGGGVALGVAAFAGVAGVVLLALVRSRRRSAAAPPAAVVLALTGLVATAGPAAADAAGPTSDRSRILAVEPDPPGARLEIVGGDAFLQLTVDEGHEALVPGYGGEPYLRFLDDGRVEVNDRSPARYLNADRDDTGALPEEASADAEPDWREVAEGGRYAWHDHRIHWMGRGSLDQRIEWQVPLRVDGRAVEVRGELEPLDRPSPVLPLALGALALGAFLLAGVRAGWTPAAALAAGLLGGVVAGGLAASAWSAQPPGAGASPLGLVVAGAALAAGVAAVLLRAAGRARPAAVATLAAGAAAAGWLVTSVDVLTNAVVPGAVPTGVARAGVGVLAGLVAATAVLGVRWAGAALAAPVPEER